MAKHNALYSRNLEKIKIKCDFCKSLSHRTEDCLMQEMHRSKEFTIDKYKTKVNRCFYERHNIKLGLELNSIHTMRSSRKMEEEFSRVSYSPLRS